MLNINAHDAEIKSVSVKLANPAKTVIIKDKNPGNNIEISLNSENYMQLTDLSWDRQFNKVYAAPSINRNPADSFLIPATKFTADDEIQVSIKTPQNSKIGQSTFWRLYQISHPPAKKISHI